MTSVILAIVDSLTIQGVSVTQAAVLGAIGWLAGSIPGAAYFLTRRLSKAEREHRKWCKAWRAAQAQNDKPFRLTDQMRRRICE